MGMTIWNLGSINIDKVYRLPRHPAPGETLAALSYATGLGGKGANQSVAAAKAGARVVHLGAVGEDGGWTLERLALAGVDVARVHTGSEATGHAVIFVAEDGENIIVIHPGANRQIPAHAVTEGLEESRPGDLLLIQNETSAQEAAAREGRTRGLRVAYSAAPFEVDAVRAVLPYLSLLLLNELEAEQLEEALGQGIATLGIPDIVVTRGARGARWITEGEEELTVPAHSVDVVDTTGAGDCFAGYLVAALDEGAGPEAAMRLAAAASALQVGRAGAADAMPSRMEVETFLAAQGQDRG